MHTTFLIYREGGSYGVLYPSEIPIKVLTEPTSTCMRRAAEKAIEMRIITKPGPVFVRNAEKQGGGRIFQIEPEPNPNLRVVE